MPDLITHKDAYGRHPVGAGFPRLTPRSGVIPDLIGNPGFFIYITFSNPIRKEKIII
jgi:hypothetical protein